MNKKVLVLIALLLIFFYMVSIVNYTWCFDTSDLMDWCSPREKIRMMGAEYYDDNAVVDDLGNIWEIDCDDPLVEDAFYLIWLTDNGTEKEVKDDEVVKIWKEIY